MPALGLVLDVERTGFAALRDVPPGEVDGRLVHLANDAQIEVGALTRGTKEGRASVAFCFGLPDGRVVIAETTLRLFLTAADTLRTLYGEVEES